jgi:hypothetical protein
VFQGNKALGPKNGLVKETLNKVFNKILWSKEYKNR